MRGALAPRHDAEARFAGSTGERRGSLCAWLAIGSLALFLPALGGCISWHEYWANGMKVGPEYCTPPADVAEDWIDAGDRRLHSTEADLSHWWTVFEDETLEELIHAAYQQNLTLREAGWRILQARAALAIAQGEFFPQHQSANGSFDRIVESTLSANRQHLGMRYFDQWDLGFNLAWELDFWGRFRRAIEAAEDDLEASVFAYDDVLVTLLGDVALTYIEMRTIQQQLAYVRENVKIQQVSLDIAQARFKGGLTSDLDVEQAISNLAQTESLVPEFEKRLRYANNRLCILLGIPTVDLTPKLGTGKIPIAPPEVAIGVPADLLRRRPDVRAAERQAAAECARIGVAESELYPHISITGTVGFEAQRFTELFKDRSQSAAIGPGFTWNVLNYGRLIANVILHDARFREFVVAYQNTVLNANAEVENGLVEFLQSQTQAKALQRSVDAAEKAVQLAITQYKAGLVDFNRVALLEQNLVQQQDLLAQAQGDIAMGLVRVYRALGGGWEIRCEPEGYDTVTATHASDASQAETIPTPSPAPRTQPSIENSPLPSPAPAPDVINPDLKPITPEGPLPEIPPRSTMRSMDDPPPAPPTSSRIRPVTATRRSGSPQRMAPPRSGGAAVSHAGLLPQDRGQVRFVR